MKLTRMFGYMSNGDACVFEIEAGQGLPPPWSQDIGVIADPALRLGEAITRAAGPTVITPVLRAPVPMPAAIMAHEIAPEPAAVPRQTKKRVGWPKGKPRGPRKKPAAPITGHPAGDGQERTADSN